MIECSQSCTPLELQAHTGQNPTRSSCCPWLCPEVKDDEVSTVASLVGGITLQSQVNGNVRPGACKQTNRGLGRKQS